MKKELLEILGTDPSYLGSDSDLARCAANLSDSDFACFAANLSDLSLARFSANLSGSDLARFKKIREATPMIKNPYTAILKAISKQGCSLEMQTWHTCETTHCIGGWTVIIAGEAGKKLEALIQTAPAAAAILSKSRPDAPLPYFYASNKAAMAFIKARAAEEA